MPSNCNQMINDADLHFLCKILNFTPSVVTPKQDKTTINMNIDVHVDERTVVVKQEKL